MDTKTRENTDLFEGYLQGNLSKADESSLFDWITISDSNYFAFKTYVDRNQFSQSHADETIHAWQKLKTKIYLHQLHQTNKKIVVPGWLKVAAVVVVALLAGFFSHRIVSDNHTAFALNEITVPKGEKAQVVLSDGTKVYLNAGTHFEYPGVFSENERNVTLTGEAFFNVAKDSSHPFMIKTPRFHVKVTGTSFDLRTYQEDEENSLALSTGKVTIITDSQNYKINPGEKFILNTQTLKSKITKADLQKSFLWREGVTVIDDLNLEEIRKLLERKFNVQIRIADEKYKTIRYTGQFKPHETLEDILDLIRKTSPVKFKYKINETKDIITIE